MSFEIEQTNDQLIQIKKIGDPTTKRLLELTIGGILFFIILFLFAFKTLFFFIPFITMALFLFLIMNTIVDSTIKYQIDLKMQEIKYSKDYKIPFPKDSKLFLNMRHSTDSEGPSFYWDALLGNSKHKILMYSYAGNNNPDVDVENFVNRLKVLLKLDIIRNVPNSSIKFNWGKSTSIPPSTEEKEWVEEGIYDPNQLLPHFVSKQNYDSLMLRYHKKQPVRDLILQALFGVSVTICIIYFYLDMTTDFIRDDIDLLLNNNNITLISELIFLILGIWITFEILVYSQGFNAFISKGKIEVDKSGIFIKSKSVIRTEDLINWEIIENFDHINVNIEGNKKIKLNISKGQGYAKTLALILSKYLQ